MGYSSEGRVTSTIDVRFGMKDPQLGLVCRLLESDATKFDILKADVF